METEDPSLSAKTRNFQGDTNLPKWVCQNCRQSICFVGADSYAEKYLNDSSYCGRKGGGVLSSSRMDNSYVVLSSQKTGDKSRGKGMEDSFVMLPPAAASVYGGVVDGGGCLNPLSPSGCFHATTVILARAFDIATAQTQVEQPVCLECMRILSYKLDKEMEDVNRDIEAYQACLSRLEGDAHDVLTEADFLEEKSKLEEEERQLESAIEEMEREYSGVTSRLKELELKSRRFCELEERYWHEFNSFQFELVAFQEERDAVLVKIEGSQAHLEVLKRTNVLSDAFPIWHDGDFGTINNFRLGRLPKIPVEWEEINAAWGQACFLLHTMSHHFRSKFPCRIRIVPMGSSPRITDTDANATYELYFLPRFGPVNIFWSTRYDKAMVLFVTCLKDLADFAHARDVDNNIPPQDSLRLPYRIENDKVEGYSIAYSFNKLESWTKALKYTLCNLKWLLYWFVGNTNFQPLSPVPTPI